MSRWIDNNLADRLYMVNHISDLKNIDQESVEKDWWVTNAQLAFIFKLSQLLALRVVSNIHEKLDISPCRLSLHRRDNPFFRKKVRTAYTMFQLLGRRSGKGL